MKLKDELKDELNSKQKLKLARRLELIFERSYVARVLGLNLRQFNDFIIGGMSND